MKNESEKLKEYVLMNSQFWTWPLNEDHEVVFLGCESIDFSFKNGTTVPSMRYRFCLVNRSEKSIDVRSLKFAELMSNFQVGDRLKIKRRKLSKQNYEYEAYKID
jgi:hypothetical protein